MPAIDIAGTTALVTGASRGFGRGIAASLSQAGAHVAGKVVETCAGVGGEEPKAIPKSGSVGVHDDRAQVRKPAQTSRRSGV